MKFDPRKQNFPEAAKSKLKLLSMEVWQFLLAVSVIFNTIALAINCVLIVDYVPHQSLKDHETDVSTQHVKSGASCGEPLPGGELSQGPWNLPEQRQKGGC